MVMENPLCPRQCVTYKRQKNKRTICPLSRAQSGGGDRHNSVEFRTGCAMREYHTSEEEVRGKPCIPKSWPAYVNGRSAKYH